jgi:SnoaL-like domain
MSTDQAHNARAACHDVLVAYLTAVDHHRGTDALPCFTHDAQVVARGQHLSGREEIGRFLAERQADTTRHTAHLIVNEVFEHVDTDHVELRARVVLLLHQPTHGYHVDQVVETSQTFRPTTTGWRIAQRDESPLHPDH